MGDLRENAFFLVLEKKNRGEKEGCLLLLLTRGKKRKREKAARHRLALPKKEDILFAGVNLRKGE